jgi:hypothetical protein
MHKAHSSQLLLLPTNTEDTHEAVSAVQVLTTAKEQFLLANGSARDSVMFS